MKISLFITIAITLTDLARAQVNYYRTSVSLDYGFTKFYGDVSSTTPLQPTMMGRLGYHPYNRLLLGVELQKGTLAAGDSVSDPHQRFFINAYRTALLVLCWQSRPVLSSTQLTIGAGAGFMVNHVREIKRSRLYPSGAPYIFPGVNKSNDKITQLLAGLSYAFKNRWLEKRCTITIDYRFIFADGDNVDGYSDPPLIFNNRNNDRFSVASVGFTFFFGRLAR